MATTRWYGREVEVRLATSEEGLTDCAAMDNVESVEWTRDPNIDRTPAGLGSNAKVTTQRLWDLTGSLSRWYNGDDVCCGDTGHVGTCGDSGTFAAVVGAYHDGELTPLYMSLTHKITGEVVILGKIMGKYSRPTSSPEGFIMEKWDFSFDEISYTEGT